MWCRHLFFWQQVVQTQELARFWNPRRAPSIRERQGTNRTGEVCCTDHCYTLLLCQFLSFLEQSSESKKPVRKLLAWRRRDNQFINAYWTREAGHRNSFATLYTSSLSLSLSHSLTLSLSHSLTLSHSHSLTLSLSHSLTLSLSHSLTLSLSHSLTLSLSRSLALSLSRSLALSLSRSLTHSLTHLTSPHLTSPHLTYSLTHSVRAHAHTRSHNLTHPHALSRAHTLSLSLSPSHTLTHSYTPSHTLTHARPKIRKPSQISAILSLKSQLSRLETPWQMWIIPPISTMGNPTISVMLAEQAPTIPHKRLRKRSVQLSISLGERKRGVQRSFRDLFGSHLVDLLMLLPPLYGANMLKSWVNWSFQEKCAIGFCKFF